MITLKNNEGLICVGNIELRAPDGTPLPSMAQYIKVSIEKADPAAIATVGADERIILAGRVSCHKQKAEERFAAMKAGREIPPKEESIALYIITDAANIDPETDLLYETSKACEVAGRDLARLISMQKRKEKALEKQGVPIA